MRVLTATEVKILEDGLHDLEVDDYEIDDENPIYRALKTNGYVRSWEDEEFWHNQTTSKGQLALRCYYAFRNLH